MKVDTNLVRVLETKYDHVHINEDLYGYSQKYHGWMIISYHPSRWPQGGYPILHPGHVTNQKQAFLFTSDNNKQQQNWDQVVLIGSLLLLFVIM